MASWVAKPEVEAILDNSCLVGFLARHPVECANRADDVSQGRASSRILRREIAALRLADVVDQIDRRVGRVGDHHIAAPR